jgi:triphosphoribosyl-dephospho-CoA synthase
MRSTATIVAASTASPPYTASPALHPLLVTALPPTRCETEAELTPKPGLVDRRGRGADSDMDLSLMMRSAEVLEP